VSQTPAKSERVALDNVIDEAKEIWHPQALEAHFSEPNQDVGPVTNQGEHLRS